MQLSCLGALGDSTYPEPDSLLLSPDTSSTAGFCYCHYVVPHLLLQTWHHELSRDCRSITWCSHQVRQQLLHWVSAWEALSNTVPLCISLAYARSRFGPENGKHLQEMLFPPPAALEVHRVVPLISVDFRAGLCSSAGETGLQHAG